MHGQEYARGLPQLVTGLAWITFGATMVIRSLRRHGVRWPLRWHLLSGLAMICAGGSFLAHGIYWMGWTDLELEHDWQLILPLWLTCFFSALAFYRWVRDPDEPR